MIKKERKKETLGFLANAEKFGEQQWLKNKNLAE